jgi:hypothetical protein
MISARCYVNAPPSTTSSGRNFAKGERERLAFAGKSLTEPLIAKNKGQQPLTKALPARY